MKKMTAFLISFMILLSLTPLASAATEGLDNFKPVRTYSSDRFTDVSSTAWYAPYLSAGYESGLINGTSDTTFSPTGNITIASTIAIAARLHSIYYTGESNFEQSDPWYQTYIDYAQQNNITTYAEYNSPASRAKFVMILESALPDGIFSGINTVPDGSIPDLSDQYSWTFDAVYKFYRAGILSGSDAAGSFKPESNIQRSEVTAIVARIIDPSLRVSFTLSSQNNTDTVVYYEDWPTAPDFGAFTGIEADLFYSEGDTSAYLYDILDFEADAITDYATLLVDEGFQYAGSFEGSDGEVIVFKNSECSISLGLMQQKYFVVMLAPPDYEVG